MLDEEFNKITTDMQEKLGKDNSAIIADSLGLLMSANKKAQDAYKTAQEEIASLKADKEKLVLANGNLLKQVPMATIEPAHHMDDNKPATSSFSFSDVFDDRGNFKH